MWMWERASRLGRLFRGICDHRTPATSVKGLHGEADGWTEPQTAGDISGDAPLTQTTCSLSCSRWLEPGF